MLPLQSTTRAGKDRPAIRLVKTQDLSRDEWLEVRKGGIGSSDAAAAVGLNPYCSALELFLIKTGQDADLDKVDPNDDTSPMYWGTLLEPMVAAAYTKRKGNRVRRVNAVLQHPKHSWMLANIDREVIGVDEVQILECKTAGMNGAKLWRDGVPEYVALQVQHPAAQSDQAASRSAWLASGQSSGCAKASAAESGHLLSLFRQVIRVAGIERDSIAIGIDQLKIIVAEKLVLRNRIHHQSLFN